jgi:hypothetical protein
LFSFTLLSAEEKTRPDDKDDMWVEKPAPDVVKEFTIPPTSSEPPMTEPQAPKGRKRAIDFIM